MKKLMLMVISAAAVFAACAEDDGPIAEINVKGVGQAQVRSAAKKAAIVDAKKQAVEKYLQKNFPGIDAKMVDDAKADYASFVTEDVEEGDDVEFEGGEFTGEFTVEVKVQALQGKLKEWGFDPNAIGGGEKIRIFVMEKPPAKVMLQNGMDPALGNYFFKNYEILQTRIKEKIGTMLDNLGYDVPSLETEEQFKEYLKDDPGLVGVHYDIDRGDGEFVIEREFLDKLRNSYPNSIILRYEIQALAKENNDLRIQLALIAVDFNGKEKKLGSADQKDVTNYTKPDMIMADFAECASRAAAKMLKSGDAADKFNKTIKSIRNTMKIAANKPKGPITVVVNLSGVDKKVRTRLKINVKNAMDEAGLCKKADIKGNGDSLSAVIKKAEITDQDGAYEAMMEIMDGVGITIDDTMKNYSSDGTVLTITPTVAAE